MSGRDDALKDYVQVNERIVAFLAKYPEGSLQSEIVDLSDSRVLIRAYAYRTPDDPRPGMGHSAVPIPGKTNFTRDSEVENAETSAWGRAIAALGFEVKRGIASNEEIRNKQDGGIISTPDHPVDLNRTPEGGLIGTAIIQGNHDFNLRQTPKGYALPFRIKDGSRSFIVRAEDKLAEALDLIKSTVIDQRVTVWGTWEDQVIPAKGNKPAIKYRVLVLERIRTPDVILPPMPGAEEPEAESIPLFDESEEETIDAALAKVPEGDKE